MARYGWIGLAALFALLALNRSCLWARSTTAREAEKVVVGWRKADPEPLGTSFGRQVRKVETFKDDNGEPIYYIVYLQPSGFVIVSADDLVEPIIGFVQGDRFDPSPENPLGALVTDDLRRRIAAARTGGDLRMMAEEPLSAAAPGKWRHFIDLANGPKDGIVIADAGIASVSDVRVAPLVKSKWFQGTVGTNCPLACYNYYTPPFTTPDGDPSKYLCGCGATALAQLLCYHEYPTTGIGVHGFTITIGWSSGVNQEAFTRGGDGSGGPYHWDLMSYEPNCDTTEVQRQAIGALCYDAGVSTNTIYGSSGSGWPGCTNARIKQALTTTFLYGNAVHGYNSESPIGRGFIGMINPNLDAKKPVILGTIPHAFVCDGYGYDYATLYHHLNLGWAGLDDAWYNLISSIRASVSGDIGILCSCVYNVQTIQAGDGEIISGRALDHNGKPISGAVIRAKSGTEIVGETETDMEGVYAFDYLQSNTTYTVNAVLKGYGFNTQEVTTGISKDNSIVSGNVWGVDFAGLPGDFNGDGKVDIQDLLMLIEHWGQNDPLCDIAPWPLGDGVVDAKDLEVLMTYWGQEVYVYDPRLAAYWKLDETGGMVAHDSIGANNGTLVGDPLWQPAGGKVKGALQFDGIDDYVSTLFVVDPGKQAFSVFAWVKGGTPGQVVLSQAGGANWLRAAPISGTLQTELNEPGRNAAKNLQSPVVITDGVWHRVGLVWDGTNRILYIDDVEVARGTLTALQASTNGLYIGAGSKLATDAFWKGLIDDVRIYDRAVKP